MVFKNKVKEKPQIYLSNICISKWLFFQSYCFFAISENIILEVAFAAILMERRIV